jgi:hypothetical protein
MEKRPFIDPKVKPGEKTLRTELGKAFTFYLKLMDVTGDFRHDWAFSKSSGWMQKIHDKKKALLYLIPLSGALRISLAMRESERSSLIADSSLNGLRSKIVSARKYSEGYALVFDISSANEFKVFDAFIQKLIALR